MFTVYVKSKLAILHWCGGDIGRTELAIYEMDLLKFTRSVSDRSVVMQLPTGKSFTIHMHAPLFTKQY